MLVPFENLPGSSKIWIYQSVKPFTFDIKKLIVEKTELFISQWDAHGKALQASYKIIHDHFLIIAVNESFNQASGCSIDKSIHLIQNIEKTCDLNLFDRLYQAILLNGNIEFKTLGHLKSDINKGIFDFDTIVFNNMINTVDELENEWQISASKSWLNKFIPVN